jgi:4-amino-4-deoxy-L-arabinose transferase-like glycosyltransferase
MSDFLINGGLILTYLMIAAAALAAIVYPAIFLAKNPTKAKSSLLGVAILLVVAVISYVIASGEIMQFPGFEKFEMTSGSTKRVGMGLILFYFLAFGAVAAVIYAELGKIFKK